jgi:hypothetical protein
VDVYRADERDRQQKHRDAAARDKRHEPASARKSLELLLKLQEIVDEAARMSRASFRRKAMRILREKAGLSDPFVAEAGARHEPASTLATAENGSQTVVGRTGVTSQHGL